MDASEVHKVNTIHKKHFCVSMKNGIILRSSFCHSKQSTEKIFILTHNNAVFFGKYLQRCRNNNFLPLLTRRIEEGRKYVKHSLFFRFEDAFGKLKYGTFFRYLFYLGVAE